MRPSVRLALTLAALLGLPGLALAQHAAKAHPKDQDVGADAVQVAVDPETRQLRQPTREEVEELLQGMEPLVNQSTEGLRTVTLPDGTRVLDLQDRFQSVSIAKVEGGRVSTDCVSTSEQARAFMQPKASAPKPATPALEEK